MTEEERGSWSRRLDVTQPSMPPLTDLIPILEDIWSRKVVTNLGPLHQQFESELRDFLGVPHLILMNNGTTALLAAIASLGIRGKVLTTPFSFVATTSSLMVAGCEPIFVDIEPSSFAMDPKKCDSILRERSDVGGIVLTHCYGLPADVDEFERIGRHYGLPIIFDAAHAFGAGCHCGNLLLHGQASALSFHATKPFHSLEGGAVVAHDDVTAERVRQFRNFGYATDSEIRSVGINGKMNEFSAAIGLLNLKTFPNDRDRRSKIWRTYKARLEESEVFHVVQPSSLEVWNYSYAAILLRESHAGSIDSLLMYLNARNVYPRRYFYPLIPQLLPYRSLEGSGACPVAENLASRVICLPISSNMTIDEASFVAQSLLEWE